MKTVEKKYNHFWDKVQIQLNKKRFSLHDLSVESGIPMKTLEKYKYSAMNPTFKKVCKIADALTISLDELRI